MQKYYLLSFICALTVSLAATPVSIWLARRFGALDPIDPRKIHEKIKPRWGGLGIAAGFFCGLGILFMFSAPFQKLLTYKRAVTRNKEVLFTLRLDEQLAGILAGALILLVLGLRDDLKPVKAGVKFLVQILAAYVAMIYGVRIYGLSLPGLEAYSHFPLWIMQLVTVLWLVGLTNAVNLIDGLDGLAGGVVAIVAGAFLGVTLMQDHGGMQFLTQQLRLAGFISASLLGAVLGFLVYNFYPARVFMGDGGSLVMGFLVGCVAVIGTFKTTILAVLFVPFLLVAVPVVDMTIAFGRRLLNKRNPFSPDRGHLHHRLLDRGWTQREVVLCVYSVTLALALVSVIVVGSKHT